MNEKWRTELLSKYGEYLGRRSYYSLNSDGSINRKEINCGIIAAAFGKNREETEKFIEEKCVWKNEKKKIRALERMSRFSIEELKKNFSKTVLKGEEVFAVKFGYELYLRDFEEFKKSVLFFATANCGDEMIPLYTVAALKLMELEKENAYIPVYLLVEMLTQYPKNFILYENANVEIKCSNSSNNSYSEIGREIALKNLKKTKFENIDILESVSEKIKELSFKNSGIELELEL